MTDIFIDNYRVGKNTDPFVIAEAGVNHNGNFELAIALIDAAAAAGADAVKFQTFRAEQVVTAAGKMADYQKRNIGKEDTQLKMLKELELPEDWYPALIKRTKEKGIIFLSTPHGGTPSVDLLSSYNIPAFKFGSGDLTNFPLLAYAASLGKPILLSTGMAYFEEVKAAVSVIKKAGNNDILIFQCTTDYPCAPEFANLAVLKNFESELEVLVGFSDHTINCHASFLAVALGASMIEKHLTLDCTMEGPDHRASMEPKEFKEMVALLKHAPRNINKAVEILNLSSEMLDKLMGDGEKRPLPPELPYIDIVRKSIVTALPIKAGEVLMNHHLVIKRPGHGLSPKYLHSILGRTLKVDVPKDILFDFEMLLDE